ncbi:MAG: flagellar basal body P-ring protein FlgI [Isosphaeraceae bacterium]
MRRMVPGRPRALGILVATAAMAVAVTLSLAFAGPTSRKHRSKPPKIHENVGDLAYVVSRGEMIVEGVGLVSNLDNTGGDSPPSTYRKILVDEMNKASVEHPERILADPRFSMVVVKMTIPMGVGPGDPIDVQVEVPPGCSTKSLAGGYLLTSRLFRLSMTDKGETLRDHELALARGPIMVGTPGKPNSLKVGRVLGGGRVKKEYPFTLVIRETRESYYTAKMLESVVNERFHQMEDGHQKGVANGKSASFLELRVPELYHQNQPRFFRVVQALPMIDAPELRTMRQATWSKELLDPKKAGVAALKLEGLGNAAIDSLKEGLKSANAQVRFFSAEALAYLNDTSGVEVLGETAIRERGFRAYALAALASLDQSASHMKLRKLMDVPDVEVRYGAFNALRTLDPTDAYLGRVRVLREPELERDEQSGDSMSLEIVHSARRRNRPEDPFALYIVDSEGPPMVHVSRTRRTEIVLFGRQQKLLPPMMLDGGDILLNASDADEKVELSKIVVSAGGASDTKAMCSPELGQVIREAANLGATYPQIVAILDQAARRRNLPGQLVVDAVPLPGVEYLEAIAGIDTQAKRDPAVGRASDEGGRSRWRLLSLFNREKVSNPTAAAAPTAAAPAGTPADGTDSTPGELPPLPGDPAAPVPPGAAGSGAAAKKDDAVQPTSAAIPAPVPASSPTPTATGPSSSPPRRRLLDIFRRGDD